MDADRATAQAYDYVIVGAGSAGCVLAHRLSMSPRNTVLLIEAGPRDTSPLIHKPKGYLRTHRDPRLRWVFPLTTDMGGGESRMTFIAGKVLGGGSSINGMAYIRGHPDDYDGWGNRARRVGAGSTSSRASRASKTTSSAKATSAAREAPCTSRCGDLRAPSRRP